MSFAELLEIDNSLAIHKRNLQVLATEMFKLKNGLAPEIMKEVFEIQNPAYNFRSEATHFKRENVKTTHHGIQSVRYLGPKIWDTVPNNVKNCSSLNKFKNSIKSWKPDECPCRLCKKYIAQVGLIWFTSTFCNISKKQFWFFIYILYLFIAQNGEVSPGFPLFFCFCFCALSLQIWWAICPRVCGDAAFSWGFPHWEIGWNFLYFVQWLSLYFVFYQFIYYYYYYFLWALVRHIHFCWCELL